MTVTKAVWNQIQSNDHRLMRRVHSWRAPRWFRILMITSTRGGDGWLWYALGIIFLLFGGPHRFATQIGAGASAARPRGFFCFARSSTPAAASGRVRSSRIVGRPCCRPISIRFRRAIRLRHSASPWRSASSGIPELQAAVCSPRPFLIAGSRIILGMHFLSDVLAGSAIGVILGVAQRFHGFLPLKRQAGSCRTTERPHLLCATRTGERPAETVAADSGICFLCSRSTTAR